MKFYSEAAMERAMKIQEVILRAIGKRINWWQAAEIIGISDRQMRRWRSRYEQYGYDGLFDRRRGKPSPRRVPLGTVEKVLGLYQEKYFDFNVRHFPCGRWSSSRGRKAAGRARPPAELHLGEAGIARGGASEQEAKRGLHRQRRPLAGYEDVNDAEQLSRDPTFRLIGSEKIWDRGAALPGIPAASGWEPASVVCR